MNKTRSRIHRRRFLRLVGTSCVALPLGLLGANTARSQGKASKEATNYQDTPKNGQKCSDCHFFIEPDGCQVVEGKISPEGWCSLFVVKQG